MARVNKLLIRSHLSDSPDETVNGEKDDEKDAKDEEDDAPIPITMLEKITIGVSILAFISFSVALVVCGLFLCGW